MEDSTRWSLRFHYWWLSNLILLTVDLRKQRHNNMIGYRHFVIPCIINVAFSLLAKEPSDVITKHWTLVTLYSIVPGMIRYSSLVPLAVLRPVTCRTLKISGGRASKVLPLIIQLIKPSSVSHANVAHRPRKIVAFSGLRSISGKKMHCSYL